MGKGNNGHYIRQLAENENLYSYLQRQTLEEVHRLSGKVWTDFNAHDPGVTLVDIANYALTEMDYKLGFGTMDYLTGEDGIFEPERFGLFPPEKVYTTAPVTPEDYRRLFFARIPDLENVWVECNAATGGYTVKIALPPFEEEDNGKTVVKQVAKIYNSHRNLCEYLDKVIIVRSAELEFHAEFEIEPGKDASIVLARLYGTILHYLSGGVYICAPEELETSGLSPEEWLEGAEGIVRVVIPMQKNTEYELYKKLCQVEGIRSFSTCYLMKDGKPQTDFSEGFSLKIPCMEKELKVRIRQGRSVMGVDMEKFTRYLKTFYYAQKRISTNESDVKGIGWGNMVGTYRNIFTYSPIAGEFPACYRLSLGQETHASFEAYLKLYDRTIQQGLEEVKELPNVLSIEEKDMGRHSSFRNIYALKSRYLDFLDHLYGVESQPEWLEESNCYGEMESETIGRRMSFLRHVAYLIKNRAKARDITMSEGEHNAPIVKEWFCRLLGINGNEEHTVGNVLPGHNLQLIEKKPDRPLADRLDALLIDERILEPEHVTAVTYEQLATDEEGKRKEYSQLRAELPIFNRNRISGDLFRHGISLGNYRIVEAKKGEYLLVVHNKEKGGWTNLGRTDNKKRLNTLTNILRRYLLELNRECETVYVLEPVLVRKTEPFRLLIVLPMWTLRFHSPRFREMCRELLRSIIPAHLAGRIYWMDEISMQGFEHCYKLLMRALTNNDLADYSAQLLEVIYELLGKAVEIQILDDTN